jgi:hypothetical protein
MSPGSLGSLGSPSSPDSPGSPESAGLPAPSGSSGTPAEQRALLDALRRRRAELRGSMSLLERALAAPATGNAAAWARQVHGGLQALSDDLALHVELTEGPDGLYAELLETAPRLAEAVARLTEEHAVIADLLDQALASSTDDVAGSSGPDMEHVASLRDLGTTLLGRLVRHRQRGSDLVYEAYEFDIGGDT